MIEKVCLQRSSCTEHTWLSSGCHLADICWHRDALRHRHILDRSHVILTLRFQSSAANSTQDTLTSIAAPQIAVVEFRQQWSWPEKGFCSASQQWACHPQVCPTSPSTLPLPISHPENTIFPLADSPLPSRLKNPLVKDWWDLLKGNFMGPLQVTKPWRGGNRVQIPETEEFIEYHLYC